MTEKPARAAFEYREEDILRVHRASKSRHLDLNAEMRSSFSREVESQQKNRIPSNSDAAPQGEGRWHTLTKEQKMQILSKPQSESMFHFFSKNIPE